MTTDTMIGIDLANNVFQVYGAHLTGQIRFRRKSSLLQFRKFMAEQPAAVVVMDACGPFHNQQASPKLLTGEALWSG